MKKEIEELEKLLEEAMARAKKVKYSYYGYDSSVYDVDFVSVRAISPGQLVDITYKGTTSIISATISYSGSTNTAGNRLAYSPTLERYVLVGFDNFYYSDDGVNWNAYAKPAWFGTNWQGTCAIWANDAFYVVGQNAAGSTPISKSTDGVNWVQKNQPPDQVFTFDYSPSLNMWVTAAPGNTKRTYHSTDDMTSWTVGSQLNMSNKQTRNIKWSSLLSKFIMVGQNVSPGAHTYETSPDGINWTTTSFGAGSGSGAKLMVGDNAIAVLLDTGVTKLISTDGSSWTTISEMVYWNVKNSIWVRNNSGNVESSLDGINDWKIKIIAQTFMNTGSGANFQ